MVGFWGWQSDDFTGVFLGDLRFLPSMLRRESLGRLFGSSARLREYLVSLHEAHRSRKGGSHDTRDLSNECVSGFFSARIHFYQKKFRAYRFQAQTSARTRFCARFFWPGNFHSKNFCDFQISCRKFYGLGTFAAKKSTGFLIPWPKPQRRIYNDELGLMIIVSAFFQLSHQLFW